MQSLTQHGPSATATHVLDTSRHGDSITALESLCQCLTALSMKKFFLISILNLLLAQLEAISTSPIWE